MTDERTSINIKESVRDELRRYKAEEGHTYDQALANLLDEVNWIEKKSNLVEFNEEQEDEKAEKETEDN